MSRVASAFERALTVRLSFHASFTTCRCTSKRAASSRLFFASGSLTLERALATDRPILLLDEATSHLDARAAARVVDALSAERHRRLIVVATHDEAIRGLADVAISLDGGARVSGARVSEARDAGAVASARPLP